MSGEPPSAPLAAFPPAPRVLDDHVEIGEARPPAEHLRRPARVRHQRGRIAGPPADLAKRNRSPRHPSDRRDDGTHRLSVPRSEIEPQGAVARAQAIQRAQVGLRQVDDVNVVADGRAVGRRVIGGEDLKRVPRAARGVDRQRDQVRLGVVVLADLRVGIGARGVEVAEGGVTEIVRLEYQCSIFSTASLLSPYGFTGACG